MAKSYQLTGKANIYRPTAMLTGTWGGRVVLVSSDSSYAEAEAETGIFPIESSSAEERGHREESSQLATDHSCLCVMMMMMN